MSNRTDVVDKLVELPDTELEQRLAAAYGRIETRIERCRTEAREMSDREFTLSEDDRNELSALKDALEIKESTHNRVAVLSEVLASVPHPAVQTRQLDQFAAMIAAGVPGRVQIEQRSR